MKKSIFLFLIIAFLSNSVFCKIRTIHVFVALCDNEHQGIVPVSKNLGNGKKPDKNLYWGAMYGIKSYFRYRTKDWKFQKCIPIKSQKILQRVLFKHATKQVFLLADAYDGEKIKNCIEDFLTCSNGQTSIQVKHGSLNLKFGGKSDLLSYIGHDGLMEFNVKVKYKPIFGKAKDIIVLACYSKHFFSPEVRKADANPVLWTTHLMAPEAYTLKSAIDGWILNESGTKIDERAARTYNQYQKCGLRGARRLFTTGF
ncbi:hypothetical protein KAJ27_00845 [bacterium]|nr:hypothetical protein [bacterium]